MNVTSKITVDMTRQNVGQRVNAVQGDGNTRLVEITLLSGGAPWTPPEGVEAAIAYIQPGGTKGLYNKLADGTAAITISGNVATVILAPQMLTVAGTVQASLVFNDQQLNRLTTFPFSVSVASNPSAGAQKVEDYIRLQWLEDKLDEYLRKAADSGAFDGEPGPQGEPGAPGKTPEYGVDYGTPEQIAGIAQAAADILKPDVNQIKDDLTDLQTAKMERYSIKTVMDSVATPHTQYYLGNQTAVGIVLPDSADVGQIITVCWYNGETAATLSITGTMLDFDYTPGANSRSEINALWDGLNWAVLGNEMAVVADA